VSQSSSQLWHPCCVTPSNRTHARQPLTQSKYTLRGHDFAFIVTAYDEADARAAAMEKRYGKVPQQIGTPPITLHEWYGHGLILEKVEPIETLP
jgi:hypothetical protein